MAKGSRLGLFSRMPGSRDWVCFVFWRGAHWAWLSYTVNAGHDGWEVDYFSVLRRTLTLGLFHQKGCLCSDSTPMVAADNCLDAAVLSSCIRVYAVGVLRLLDKGVQVVDFLGR